MNVELISVVLYNALGLAVLWGVAWLWRAYKIDKLRQDIFDLRGELFDLARQGQVGFNTRSYVRLRFILNSMIRFAHQFSFVRLAATLVLERAHPLLSVRPSFADELMNDADLDADSRLKLKQVHDRLLYLVKFQIFTTSIAAFPAVLLYFAYILAKHVLMGGKTTVRDPQTVGKVTFEYPLERHLQLMERQAVENRQLELQKREVVLCP